MAALSSDTLTTLLDGSRPPSERSRLLAAAVGIRVAYDGSSVIIEPPRDEVILELLFDVAEVARTLRLSPAKAGHVLEAYRAVIRGMIAEHAGATATGGSSGNASGRPRPTSASGTSTPARRPGSGGGAGAGTSTSPLVARIDSLAAGSDVLQKLLARHTVSGFDDPAGSTTALTVEEVGAIWRHATTHGLLHAPHWAMYSAAISGGTLPITVPVTKVVAVEAPLPLPPLAAFVARAAGERAAAAPSASEVAATAADHGHHSGTAVAGAGGGVGSGV